MALLDAQANLLWFSERLIIRAYRTARIATKSVAITVYCTSTLLFTLPEATWIPIPPLSRDGETLLSGKPLFIALPDA